MIQFSKFKICCCFLADSLYSLSYLKILVKNFFEIFSSFFNPLLSLLFSSDSLNRITLLFKLVNYFFTIFQNFFTLNKKQKLFI